MMSASDLEEQALIDSIRIYRLFHSKFEEAKKRLKDTESDLIGQSEIVGMRLLESGHDSSDNAIAIEGSAYWNEGDYEGHSIKSVTFGRNIT